MCLVPSVAHREEQVPVIHSSWLSCRDSNVTVLGDAGCGLKSQFWRRSSMTECCVLSEVCQRLSCWKPALVGCAPDRWLHHRVVPFINDFMRNSLVGDGASRMKEVTGGGTRDIPLPWVLPSLLSAKAAMRVHSSVWSCSLHSDILLASGPKPWNQPNCGKTHFLS